MATPRTLTATTSLHSPRWGHGDAYSFVFDAKGISVEGTKGAHYDGASETWSGHRGKHALLNCMSDDSIYAPKVVESLVARIWKQWKSKELTDDQARQAISDLGNWINACTAAKPGGDLWDRIW